MTHWAGPNQDQQYETRAFLAWLGVPDIVTPGVLTPVGL
jgi:hypothetical protein